MLDTQDLDHIQTLLERFLVPNGSRIAIPMGKAINDLATPFLLQLANNSGYAQQDWNGYEIQFVGSDVSDAILHVATNASGPDVAALRCGESFREERGFDRLFVKISCPAQEASAANISVRILRDRFARMTGWQGPRCLGVVAAPLSAPVTIGGSGQFATLFGNFVGSLGAFTSANGVSAANTIPSLPNGRRLRAELFVQQSLYTGITAADLPLEVNVSYDSIASETIVPPGSFYPFAGHFTAPFSSWLRYVFSVNAPASLLIQAMNNNAATQQLAFFLALYAEDETFSPYFVHQVGAKFAALSAKPVLGGFAVHSREAQAGNPINYIISNQDTGAGVFNVHFRRYLSVAQGGPMILGTTSYDDSVAANSTKEGGADKTSAITLVLPFWSVAPTVTDAAAIGIAQ